MSPRAHSLTPSWTPLLLTRSGGRGSLDAHLGRVLEADDIDYDTDPLRIFPVVGGWLHEGVSTIANVVTLPVAPGKAAAFEAATLPAFATLDAEEEGAHCYLLVKQPDESNYHFIELFADKESEKSFGANPAWKAMAERQTEAKFSDRANGGDRKATWALGVEVCVSTSRKPLAHAATPKL